MDAQALVHKKIRPRPPSASRPLKRRSHAVTECVRGSGTPAAVLDAVVWVELSSSLVLT